MKILFLSDEFPPQCIGGAGVAAHRLSIALRDKGHDIYVITRVRKKALEEIATEKGIKVYRVYSNYHERWRAYLSLYNPSIVKRLKQIIKIEKPDVIHAHNIHIYISYKALKIARQSGAKVFITAHDMMFFHYGKLTDNIDSTSMNIPENINYNISILKQIKN